MRRLLCSGGLAGAALASALLAACGGNDDDPAPVTPAIRNPKGGNGGASGGGAGNASKGGAAGSSSAKGGANAGGQAGSAGSIAIDPTTNKLVIDPTTAVIDAAGAPVTRVFTAKTSDGAPALGVKWEVADVSIGTIAATGVFTSKGQKAGSTTITARAGDKTATATVEVRVAITDEPKPLTAVQKTKLDGGGTNDGAAKIVYPYDKTVFPRGLSGPTVQLAGTDGEAYLVKLSVGGIVFKGYYQQGGPARLPIPASAWLAITQSAGAGQDVSVEITKLVGGAVTGPLKQTWRIAQGSLAGNVYYNSYNSTLNGNGAILRIKPGKNAELVSEKGQCVVCHSVSAKGNVLVTGINWADKDDPNDAPGNPVESGSFDVGGDGVVKQRYKDSQGRRYSFGALTPDGSYMLSNGVPIGGSPVRGLTATAERPANSKVYDTKSGAEIPAVGFDVDVAITPVFAPDGTKVAFNYWGGDRAGKVLSVMDFDGSTTPPKFANRVDLITTPERGVAAWPSFLPDTKGVLFHDGNRFDTEKSGESESHANIRLVDLATKAVKKLQALNGYAGDVCNLPGGDKEDCALAFEPSVLPVPVGGYYWVYFTSRRTYGNIISADVDEFVQNSRRKKLWVAAIDVDWAAPGKEDPSHPAFYLPGQELEAGNMRAFAALEPCKANGSTCESGGDCCGGTCIQNGVDASGGPVLQCLPPVVGTCAQTGNACKTSADCCGVNEGTTCIAGQCALKTPN